LLEERRHFVDTAVRGGVHFDVIGKSVGVDRFARRARVTRLGTHAAFTVERFCQDPTDRGFPDTARASKEIGVMQAPSGQRMGERTNDVILTDKG
jgi:hypothetical protein